MFEKSCYIMGPTGPKGEADIIEIGNTTTVDASKKAQVIDRKNGNKHILDFEIPQGKTGATGPLPIVSFAYKFNDQGDVINLVKQVSQGIFLNRIGESRGIIVDIDDLFVIDENGIYKISYYFSGSIDKKSAFLRKF